MKMTFQGRVALVTGAARGIGKAIAEAFAREHAHVILNDFQQQEDLAKIAEGCSTSNSQCLAIQADVSDAPQVNHMMAQVQKIFKRLDILVNNAGIIRRGSIETVTEDEWDQVIRVNLKGTFNCCKAAADMMIKQRSGKIINVSSIAGKTGDITSAPGYGPSKAGVDALTKTLARQLAAYGEGPSWKPFR
jgi:3-oxoacyl-[acyl-carrier protein] reductase